MDAVISLAKKMLPDWVKDKIKTHLPRAVNKVTGNIDFSGWRQDKKYYFVYHCGDAFKQGKHHLKSWLPIFLDFQKNNSVNFILLVRNREMYNWVRASYPGVSVFYCNSNLAIEEFVQVFSNIKLYLYSSCTANNLVLIRFNDIKHVFIGHGDSEKDSSAHKALRIFDEVWTSGQAHIDRFANLPIDFSSIKFQKIGRPGLRTLLSDREGNKLTFDGQKGSGRAIYLPTWEGGLTKSEYCSLDISAEIINVLERVFGRVSAKFHPCTGNRDPKFREIMNNIAGNQADQKNSINVINIEDDIINVIGHYDLFVCDISSVISECLSVDVPIFLFMPVKDQMVVVNSNIHFNEYCYIFSTPEELELMLDKVLSGDDYLASSRARAVDYFIGVNETKNNQMLKTILENN